MKRCIFIIAIAVLLAAGAPSYGQGSGGGIKVTSVLHDDGSRTDTQTDMEALTSESKTYDSQKRLIQRATYVVDDQGRPVEGIIYNAKGNVISRIAYTRDALGRTKEQLDKAPNGTLLRRLVYSYSADGRVNGIDTYDGQGNLLKGSAPATSKKTGKPKR